MESFAIGQWLRIKTVDEHTVEGQLFAFDPKSDCVVINSVSNSSLPTQQKLNFSILKPSFIASVVGIEQPKKAVAVEPLRQSARLNLEKLQVRERNAVRAMEESIAKIGVGVSERAQTIFDALAKTLPCRWEGEAIVIMEEVRISPPYKLENIVGSSTASLQHVRKVLKHQGLV